MSRTLPAVLLAVLATVAACTPAPLRAEGVSEAEFAQLVRAVLHEPGGMTRVRPILERLSAPRMAQAIAATGNTHFTWLYPMILRAQDYPALEGLPIGQLSVVALHDGRVVPIPFQIDERQGRHIAMPDGVQPSGDEKPGVLDPDDVLVFLPCDAGAHTTPEALAARVPGTTLQSLGLSNLP